jgi:ribosome-interacting GTPase 1
LSKSTTKTPFLKCQFCPETFLTVNHMSVHEHSIHSEEIQSLLRQYTIQFNKTRELNNIQQSVSKSIKKQLKCQFCAITLSTVNDMVFHEHSIHSEEIIICHSTTEKISGTSSDLNLDLIDQHLSWLQ